jgi:hypothetical protein
MKIWFVFLILVSFTARADEVLEQNISINALGMGNAYLSHSRGHDAIFYNPAGLANLKGVQWRLAGINLGLNGLDSYSEYSDIIDNSNDLPSVLNRLYGKPVWARTDLQTSISLGSLIFGAYARGNVGFTLLNPALPNLQSNYFADYTFFAGWGTEVIPSYLDVGFVGKRVTRLAGGVQIGASSLAYLDSNVLEDSIMREGTGYGLDFGAKLKFPTPWNPSVSFAWQDIGDTSYSIKADSPQPMSTKDRMHIGIGFEKDFTAFVLRPAIDYRYLNSSNVQVGKQLHAGLEIELPIIALRGGFNQGYYTAGISFDFWLLRLDAATYGVELGEYPGQQEDRRYALQISADIGFDGSSLSKMFSINRSRRAGLKQRR